MEALDGPHHLPRRPGDLLGAADAQQAQVEIPLGADGRIQAAAGGSQIVVVAVRWRSQGLDDVAAQAIEVSGLDELAGLAAVVVPQTREARKMASMLAAYASG